ncbi:MAG: biotin--[Blautia sp.]|nr:biotin--[acetyl-CoA-carboxylase] ligase [Blautia sp.]
MIRQRILQDLAEAGQTPLSGQVLADRYGVSRNAIWKAIRTLQKNGYPIAAAGRKGYVLEAGSDILNADEIRSLLDEDSGSIDIRVFTTIDSTNTEIRRMVNSGFQGEVLVLSETQSHGRGREGRTFFSPARTGLYYSLLLRPEAGISQMPQFSRAAGVAVCEAVLQLTGIRLQIRKVNDLYLDGQKAGGILSEAFSEDLESERITGLVIGVGLNLTTEVFPDSLRGRATSLMATCTRNQLAAEITNQLRRIDPAKEDALTLAYQEWHA